MVIKEDYLKIKNLKIHYIIFEKSKNFPSVILIHPFLGSLYNWTLNFRTLSKNFRVIAFDIPGFGYSNYSYLNSYTIEFFGDVLNEIMKKLKIKKASLVGNSLGGQISAFFAIKYPEKVEKLVLVDSAGVSPLPLFFREFLKSLILYFGPFIKFFKPPKLLIKTVVNYHFYKKSKISERFAEDIIKYIYSIDYSKLSKVIYQVAYTVLDTSLRDKLSKIKSPTLVLWGKQDRLFLFCNAIYFAKNIKNSKLVILDKCGHFPNIEKAEEFNKIVNEFLLE